MARRLYAFDDDGIRKLRADHERLKRQYHNLAQEFRSLRDDASMGHVIRSGITTTNSTNSVYPTGTGSVFVVRYQDWTYPETPGNQSITRANWASKYVMASATSRVYIPQNTPVTMVKMGGQAGRRWWIIDAPIIYQAVAAATLSAGGSGNCTLYVDAASIGVTVTVHNKWMHGGESIPSGTGLWIIWMALSTSGAGRWEVLEPECTPRSGS